MIILGLNYGHDGSACIVKDGRLLSAISSERITKVKKDDGLTDEVIDYVLECANIDINDVDEIAVSDVFPHSSSTIKIFDQDNNIELFTALLHDNDIYRATGEIRNRKIPVNFICHHLAHNASAFYTSNFNKSWCFSMDSSFLNVKNNSMIAFGNGNKLDFVKCPGMTIGAGYAWFTEFLGLGPALHKAGTTMGLASYGKSDINIESFVENSFFDQETPQEEYYSYYEQLWYYLNDNKILSNPKIGMNIAGTIQKIFEQSLLKCINGIDNNIVNNLCLSGGSLLNCNANSVVKNKSKFKNIHHFPACGDDGISIGCALYLAHHIYNEPRHNYKPSELCFLGKDYNIEEPDYNEIAKEISSGKIIAWFMGKSEYGPRALGHRSILADPRNYHNRELINFIVKRREWFRPFGPSILEEHTKEWFDFDGTSPYMLYTAKVLKPKEIPAVTHVDGTARIQTVNYNDNPHYYNLIKAFYKITNVPIVLNTSLNGNGTPILETEEDALNFFRESNIDILVLNGKIMRK